MTSSLRARTAATPLLSAEPPWPRQPLRRLAGSAVAHFLRPRRQKFAVAPGLSVPPLRPLRPLRGLTASATCIWRGLVAGAVSAASATSAASTVAAASSRLGICDPCVAWRPRPPATNAAHAATSAWPGTSATCSGRRFAAGAVSMAGATTCGICGRYGLCAAWWPGGQLGLRDRHSLYDWRSLDDHHDAASATSTRPPRGLTSSISSLQPLRLLQYLILLM